MSKELEFSLVTILFWLSEAKEDSQKVVNKEKEIIKLKIVLLNKILLALVIILLYKAIYIQRKEGLLSYIFLQTANNLP